MIVVGIDPSMTHTGLVRGRLDIDTMDLGVHDMKLVVTEKGAKTKKIRVNSDDLERARSLYDTVSAFVRGADMVFAEMPLGSQNASAMKGYGMCLMMLATIQAPLIQVMPDEVKVCAMGKKTATKQEMIEWATQRYPNAPWLRARNNPTGHITGDNEHLADAIGVINAGLQHDDFRSALAILRFQQRAKAA